MIITCDECNSRFRVSDDLIKDSGSKVRCSICDSVFVAYPHLLAEAISTKVKAKIGVIFISYSRKDKEYLLKLIDYLEKEGLSIWVDDRIDHGDRWWQTIVTKIRKCAAMVVVMTPESEKTKWVEREMMFADQIDKPIFPLLLDGDCFPFFVNQQYHDVSDGSMPPKRFIETLGQYGR